MSTPLADKFKKALNPILNTYTEIELLLADKPIIIQDYDFSDDEFDQLVVLAIHHNPELIKKTPPLEIAKLKASAALAFIEYQQIIFKKEHKVEEEVTLKIYEDKIENNVKASKQEQGVAEEKKENIAKQPPQSFLKKKSKPSDNMSKLTRQAALKRIKEDIDRGDVLKDEIAKNFLLSIKAVIENKKDWKVVGGIVIPGLNNDNPVPDTVAHIYKHIQHALVGSYYWRNVLRVMKPHMNTATKKSSAISLFLRPDRSKDTAEFYKYFSQQIGMLEDLLNNVDKKIKDKREHISEHKSNRNR